MINDYDQPPGTPTTLHNVRYQLPEKNSLNGIAEKLVCPWVGLHDPEIWSKLKATNNCSQQPFIMLDINFQKRIH